jgi:hypothetical protein
MPILACMNLDASLRASLVSRFADAVMQDAALPATRRQDVEEAPSFSAADGDIICTCGITGSTYAEPWDGNAVSAETFAQSAGEATAALVARTPRNHHYAWLFASR